MATEEKAQKIYPHLAIETNKKPNRLYAFPVVGIIIKMVMLIPVFIESFFLGLAFLFFWISNSFVILFTGQYWDAAYDFFLGLMRFSTKIYAFILGLTDTYPGFNLATNNLFELTIEKPKHPNRWFAFPLLGLVARAIMIIPFAIFAKVLQNGSGLAMIASWFAITFQKPFPISLYEFEHDAIRVNLSSMCYLSGLSDRYPSFSISMKHQTVKIILIIGGVLMLLMNSWGPHPGNRMAQPYQYQNQFNGRMNQRYNDNRMYPQQRPMYQPGN